MGIFPPIDETDARDVILVQINRLSALKFP